MLRPDGVVPDFRMIDNTPAALRKLVGKMGPPEELVACYEASPTGYDTYRLLTSLGVRYPPGGSQPRRIPWLWACGCGNFPWP